jgi:hypothetical protein
MTERNRYLITVGMADYDHLPEDDQLPGVRHEVRTVVELFCNDLGYSRVLQELAASPPAGTVRSRLSAWLTHADRRPDDLLVLYWSGHGETGLDGRHHLLGSDFDGNYVAKAIATEELGHMLAGSPVRSMLVMLDTCFAGQGITDLGGMRHAVESTTSGNELPGGGIFLVASSRRKEQAADGVFSAMLVDAFNSQRHGGVTQPYLDPLQVVGAVIELASGAS